MTDGFVTSWAPSAMTCVFAKRLVRFAARSSAARRVSRLAVFKLLLFATACSTASSRVNSGGGLTVCPAACPTGRTRGTEMRDFDLAPAGANIPKMKAKQSCSSASLHEAMVPRTRSGGSNAS